MDELNEQYRIACQAQTRKRMLELVGNYIDDDTVDSARKQTVLDMIATLIAMR